MYHDEVVVRRKWMEEAEFLDLLAATNLIPGPNSTEMSIHIGYRRAGWQGLIAAGALFILPAALITIAFAWAYARFRRHSPGSLAFVRSKAGGDRHHLAGLVEPGKECCGE